MCKCSKNDVNGIIYVAMVTDANFTLTHSPKLPFFLADFWTSKILCVTSL